MRTSGTTAPDAQRTGGRGITSVGLGDPALEARITERMRECEDLLTAELSVGEDFLIEQINHLKLAGGKRFRPMFTFLAAEFGADAGARNVTVTATVLELVHLATLYHDDVMDEAELRRGAPSANARWDNAVAILSGDFLFAVASRLLAGLGAETVAHFARTFQGLVTGQLRESLGCPPDGDAIEHYMNVIREKTGVLIAAAGRLGALHAGADEETIAALERYGDRVGLVFQIVDDIIDIRSESAESGKTPGTDLREGVFTLPVLYALREEGPVGDRLREILVGPVTDDALVEEALDLLSRSGGSERALEDVRRLVAEAEDAIAGLPDIPARAALAQLAEYTVRRVG